MPERFAQESLGHGSKAVHRAYSKKAQVNLPSMEEYERRAIRDKTINHGQFEQITTTTTNNSAPMRKQNIDAMFRIA